MANPDDVVTVARPAEYQQIIKGSRFLGHAERCPDEDRALAVIERTRRAYPDANHVCFAYRIASVQRFSDDGEPGGTAGRPMAEVLTRRGLDRVVGVVARVFGGTRLGAGGLVRAYSGTLARTLDLAGVAVLPALVELELHAPFAESEALFRLLDERPDVQRLEVGYRADGLSLRLRLPAAAVATLERLARDASRGTAALSEPRPLPPLNER